MGVARAGANVALDRVTKTYRGASGPHQVLDALSIAFAAGEAYAILGPNGCGKSTLLDLVAGLTVPDSGTIDYDGDPPSVALVFQNYRESLLPWLSVRENIEWPVRDRLDGAGQRQRLDAIIAFVAARVPLTQRAGSLSGGQAQLVALARAWAFAPGILICDEPFSALDIVARRQLTEVMTGFCAREAITSITVTHSIEDALYVANHLLVVAGPPLRLVGTVHVDHTLPRGADFVGSPTFDESWKATTALIRSINDAYKPGVDR